MSKYSLPLSSDSECGGNGLQNNKNVKPTIKKEPNSDSDSELDDHKSKDKLPNLLMVNHGEIKNELNMNMIIFGKMQKGNTKNPQHQKTVCNCS